MMQGVCKIGGVAYDVHVVELIESFNILYSDNTGRTLAQGAPMTLDPLGTFIGHRVTFSRVGGKEKDYDRLYEYTYQPRTEGIDIEIVHLQKSISYKAYVSQGERAVERVDPVTKKVYYGQFTLNIVPMEAQILP